MAKLIKLIVALAIIAVAGYVFVQYSGRSGGGERVSSNRNDQPDQRPGVEEKYGFTTETVGS